MSSISRVLAPVHDLFSHPALRSALLKLRLPLGVAAAAVLVLLIDPEWFWPGIAVSAAGALFQLWCFSCIDTHRELALNGPYMFTRNPMYIARFFLILGILLLTGNLLVVAAYVVTYYLYMVNRVKREEKKLSEIFGEPYARYCAAVPRFLPTFRRHEGGSFLFFRWEFFRRQHGAVNALTVVAFYTVCYVVTFLVRG